MKIYLEAALRATNKTICLIEGSTDNTKFDVVKSDLQDALLGLAHYVGDVYGRKQQYWDTLSEEDKCFLLAFIYLNNQLKHDCSLHFFYFEVCGSMFPMRFPFRFGTPGIYWSDFENHERHSPPLRPYYDQHLKDKDIKVSLGRLQVILATISEIV